MKQKGRRPSKNANSDAAPSIPDVCFPFLSLQCKWCASWTAFFYERTFLRTSSVLSRFSFFFSCIGLLSLGFSHPLLSSCRALFLLNIMVLLLPARNPVAHHCFIPLNRRCLLPSMLSLFGCRFSSTHSFSLGALCVVLVKQTLSPAAYSPRSPFRVPLSIP